MQAEHQIFFTAVFSVTLYKEHAVVRYRNRAACFAFQMFCAVSQVIDYKNFVFLSRDTTVQKSKHFSQISP